MPKAKKKRDVSDQESLKDNLEGFRAGIKVNLDKKTKDGEILRDALSIYVKTLLQQELDNQAPRIEKIVEWERQFRGFRPERNYPFRHAANCAVPVTRAGADTIYVRLEEVWTSKTKLAIIRPKKDFLGDTALQIENSLDVFTQEFLDLPTKLKDPVMQSVKTGKGIIKMLWEEKKDTFYRYATAEEKANKKINKYKRDAKKKGEVTYFVKDVWTKYVGPDLYGIPREDWVQSIDSRSIDDALICGFKKEYRLSQLRRLAKNVWDSEDIVETLTPDTEEDEVKESRLESEHKEIRRVKGSEKFDIWEIWTEYDVDDDGEPDDLMITIHKDSGTILDCIYNPMFGGFRPFIDCIFYPSQYSNEGEGVCEILERLQIHIDTLNNQRLDRMTEINAPLVFVRAGCGLDDYELNPGEVTVVTGELTTSVLIERFPDTYQSTEREEGRLIDYSYRAIGISPENQGQPTSERPVFKEALLRTEETQKKFKSGRHNVVRFIEKIYVMMLEMFAQYSPSYKYSDKQGEKYVEKLVRFPVQYIKNGFEIKVEAADDIYNVESRREKNLTLYHLIGDFMTKSASMVQAITSQEIPSSMKQWLEYQYEISVKIFERIVKDFDTADAEMLTKPLGEIIDVQQNIKNSIDLLQAQQAANPFAGEQPPQGTEAQQQVTGMPGGQGGQ